MFSQAVSLPWDSHITEALATSNTLNLALQLIRSDSGRQKFKRRRSLLLRTASDQILVAVTRFQEEDGLCFLRDLCDLLFNRFVFFSGKARAAKIVFRRHLWAEGPLRQRGPTVGPACRAGPSFGCGGVNRSRAKISVISCSIDLILFELGDENGI
jgi:hypothetical protein